MTQEEMSDEQIAYLNWLEQNWPMIEGVYQSKNFWKNGGWNGMMDALNWVSKHADEKPPEVPDGDTTPMIEYAMEHF
jgi:hypothetical protein